MWFEWKIWSSWYDHFFILNFFCFFARHDRHDDHVRHDDLDADLWQLNVSVDVEPVVLAGQHDGAVVHERNVEALRVLHLTLEGRQKLE